MAQPQDLGNGWMAALDPGSGRTYYANTGTVRSRLLSVGPGRALFGLWLDRAPPLTVWIRPCRLPLAPHPPLQGVTQWDYPADA